MLKRGEINNCEKCNASYGQYGGKNPDQWSEYWCEMPFVDEAKKEMKTPKGLCQFCNHKTSYYVDNKKPE